MIAGIQKKNILVVDDDEDLRFTLKDLLMEEGYTVALAGNGHEAVESVSNSRYDVVLMDVVMPVMNGFEALKEIKSGNPDLKVIMMTGFPRELEKVDAVKLGAAASLKKPFSVVQLMEIIES